MKRQTRNYILAVAAIVAMTAYGSLYPFDFAARPAGSAGALRTFLDGWNRTPGRGDFISNILLYAPLGFFGAMLAVSERPTQIARRVALVVAMGACLSFSDELLQYYDGGRDTEATDFYANVIGTSLGALGGQLFGRDVSWEFLGGVPMNPVPVALLAGWLGYRLYPYVPTIDLHKYWDAVKPVFVHPEVTPYQIFRQTAVWLAICLLLGAVARPRQATRLFLAYAALVLAGGVLILSTRITPAHLAGMTLAFAMWRLLPTRRCVGIAAAAMAVYVPAMRLEPFQFGAAGAFTWVPFLSFMRGSIDLDVQSFFEKFFLYGALIWLLTRSGLRLPVATTLTAMLLFVTSLLEIYLSGRSAEITDALMALGIGAMIWLLEREPGARSDTLSARIVPAEPRAAPSCRPDTLISGSDG